MKYVIYTSTFTDSWDSWAESIGNLSRDGAYSFTVDEYPGGVFCGIARSGIAQDPTSIEYSFYIESNKYSVAAKAVPLIPLSIFERGSKFEIQILGGELRFIVNGAEVHSISKNWFSENVDARLFFCAYSYSDTIYDTAASLIQSEASIFASYAGQIECATGSEDVCLLSCESQLPKCTAFLSETASVSSNTYPAIPTVYADVEDYCSISAVAYRPKSTITDVFKPSITRIEAATAPVLSYISAAYPLRIMSQSCLPASVLVAEDSQELSFCEVCSRVSIPISFATTNDQVSNGAISAITTTPVSLLSTFDSSLMGIAVVSANYAATITSVLSTTDGPSDGLISASAFVPVSSLHAADLAFTGTAVISGVWAGSLVSLILAADGYSDGIISAEAPAPASNLHAADLAFDDTASISGIWTGNISSLILAEDGSSNGVVSATAPGAVSSLHTADFVLTGAASISGILTGNFTSLILTEDGSSDGAISAEARVPVSAVFTFDLDQTYTAIVSGVWAGAATSIAIAEYSTKIDSSTFAPEAIMVVESFYGNNASVVAWTYSPISIPSVENDFFFCAELGLPIISMEFLGEGSLFGRLPISITEGSSISAAESGSMILDNGGPSFICNFLDNNSALYCGALVLSNEEIFAVSGGISAVCQAANVYCSTVLEIFGELLSGSTILSSEIIGLRGLLSGAEVGVNEIIASSEDEIIVIRGSLSNDEKVYAEIDERSLFEVSGELSSLGCNAVITGFELFCIDEYSVISQEKTEHAIITDEFFPILEVSGRIDVLCIRSSIISGSRKNVLMDFNGRLYAIAGRQRPKSTYSISIMSIKGSLHATSGQTQYETINNMAV